MTIEQWAEQYRVKMTKGRQGSEDLVFGKYGEIAEGDGALRLRLLAVPRDKDMNKALNIRKRQAGAGGLKPVHVTENVYESMWGFRPDNDEHSRLAIDLLSPKKRRTVVLSEERRAALIAILAAARAVRTGGIAPKIASPA